MENAVFGLLAGLHQRVKIIHLERDVDVGLRFKLITGPYSLSYYICRPKL